MNRRMKKKKHLPPFTEYGFSITVETTKPSDQALDAFLTFCSNNGIVAGGCGGTDWQLYLSGCSCRLFPKRGGQGWTHKTYDERTGTCKGGHRSRSLSDIDRMKVSSYLSKENVVKSFMVSELEDANYGPFEEM
jgi:uncharacterized protein YggL (DUF469 family)